MEKFYKISEAQIKQGKSAEYIFDSEIQAMVDEMAWFTFKNVPSGHLEIFFEKWQ